jgi:hypothetical protein
MEELLYWPTVVLVWFILKIWPVIYVSAGIGLLALIYHTYRTRGDNGREEEPATGNDSG